MRYFGGKAKIAPTIAKLLTSVRGGRDYLEPFLGAANVFCLMDNPRLGSDINTHLMLLLSKVQNGTFEYPKEVSEETYKYYQKNKSLDAMRAFVGFGCSFAGKWFGGYARSKTRQDYCKCAAHSLRKKARALQGATLTCSDYRSHKPKDNLVYCDPPYENTTKINGWWFDINEFWETVRDWSYSNLVITSGYQAPNDFRCILIINTKTDIRTSSGPERREEKLFMYDKKSISI